MILNLIKPVGWTSFDVVKKVRGITRENKVGHGGTLDPFASGVLIIGTGPDTKKLAQISADIKAYTAVLKLGARTDTLDLEGQIVEEKPIPALNNETVKTALGTFLGPQEQVPPMYSAKQVDGQRLYKLARKNIEIEREPVPIIIHSIELIEWEKTNITFSVVCSKGTYIRVLGSDIAAKLGTAGHLIELTRTSVGVFNLEEALTIKQFEEQWKSSAA